RCPLSWMTMRVVVVLVSSSRRLASRILVGRHRWESFPRHSVDPGCVVLTIHQLVKHSPQQQVVVAPHRIWMRCAVHSIPTISDMHRLVVVAEDMVVAALVLVQVQGQGWVVVVLVDRK